IANGPGIESLALSPELYADGVDPSGSEACAIVNPERGFHRFVDLRSLDADTLQSVAEDGSSVLYGRVLLAEYRDAPLDSAVLDEIAAGFVLVRMHGMKVVPRFHYSDDIDEPDASLERILEHIEQLTPLLQQHADVILTLQAGFIGAWGEWHASQNGLDAPGPRKQILDALLAALPANRTVSVRRPSFKQDAYGGPLDSATAHDGSALSRVGHVNDCFLASDSDFGTYQVDGEKDYAIGDSAHVPVGGETCAVNPPRSECPSALEELALHHWTYLNADYHPDVLMSWEQDGCYAEIACRLGYRLALTDLRWATSGSPGGVLPIELELFNDGFAAPTNARPLNLVLDGPAQIEVETDLDIRKLLPGESQAICIDAELPAELPAGTYRIGLRLADPALAEDPRQAIRLVNGEWAEGINWFDATFEVN
ncbi:MAG TPA: DUF4832 domain-containing protein, partial [Enhygromyxa sp.]|nr:DUF4832 domain-containing protein [Enhygromyxa sp.]